MKTVLVTGCAGFIGSNLTRVLLEKDFNVVGIDNFDPYYAREIKEHNLSSFIRHPSFTFHEADILDVAALDKIFGAHPFDHIVHLAAKAGVRPSLLQPELYEQVNVGGTINILEQAAKMKVRNLVLASSSSVYGNDFGEGAVESQDNLRPISPYAFSKLKAEQVAFKYQQQFGMDINVLRFFTAYGPGQRPDMAFMKFAKAIMESRPIQLYGGEKMGRDFTYIGDIVNGILLSLNYSNGYEIFNLGSGREVKVSEVIRLLSDALGKEAIVEEIEVQAGDPVSTRADIQKAGRMLGYQPNMGLQMGVELFVGALVKQQDQDSRKELQNP